MSIPRNVKLAALGAIILLILAGAGYFLNCVARDPLFSYNRPLDSGVYQYRYYFGTRLNFCWNFLFQPRSPKGQDRSVAIPIMGTQAAFRLPVDTPRHSDYNSNPPTSGWNWPSEGRFAVWKTPRHKYYAEAVNPEVVVTKMYAGFVWITYRRGEHVEAEIKSWRKTGISEEEIEARIARAKERPGVSGETIEALKNIASRTPIVIVSGRGGNGGADVSLNALGRQDKFNLENGKLTQEHVDRIWNFIIRYRNQPEPFERDLLYRQDNEFIEKTLREEAKEWE